MSTTLRSACLHLSLAAALLSGCAQAPSALDLHYRPNKYARKLSQARVGVYNFDDARPGWPANAAMLIFEGTSNGQTLVSFAEGEKAMNVFVAQALRQELVATGLRVAAEPEFDRSFSYATPASMTAARVNRVIVGRINYFGIVNTPPPAGVITGGLAGAMEQLREQAREREGVAFGTDTMPTKAYVDLDLRVVEPDSGKIVWARTARLKRNAGFLSGKIGDTVAEFLSETLAMAFQQAMWNTDFVAALGATVAPPAATPAKASPAASR